MISEYILECPLLGKEAERELIIKAQNGDKEALNYLVLSNSRLVITVAKKFREKGLDEDELFQVGIMGLMRSIQKFDLSKETKLGTYSYKWIQQHIVRAIHNLSRTIRIPDSLFQKNYQLVVATKQLEQELQRNITPEELAEFTEKPLKEIKLYNETMVNCCSIDQLIRGGENNNMDVSGTIADTKGLDVISDIMSKEMLKTIAGILSEREFNIFSDRLGLVYKPKTFEIMAIEYRVTKQRIHQIYREILTKLKRNHALSLYKCS